MVDFVGESLLVMGFHPTVCVLASVGALAFLAVVFYAVALVKKIFHGENTHGWQRPDCSAREMTTLCAMAAITVWLGLYPQPVLDTAASAINGLRNMAAGQYQAGAE